MVSSLRITWTRIVLVAAVGVLGVLWLCGEPRLGRIDDGPVQPTAPSPGPIEPASVSAAPAAVKTSDDVGSAVEAVRRDAESVPFKSRRPTVRFAVLGPDGCEVKSARIRGTRAKDDLGDEQTKEWDFDHLEVQFVPGSWTFRALSTSMSWVGTRVHDLLSEPVTLNLWIDEPAHEVELRLKPYPAIFGSVRISKSARMPMVFCWKIEAGGWPDSKELWDHRRLMPSSEFLEGDGAYAFEGLSAGRYVVAAGEFGRTPLPTEVILVGDPVRVDLSMPEGPQPGDLFVRVQGPGGAVCEKLGFGCNITDDGGVMNGHFGVGEVAPTPDGSYWLTPSIGWVDTFRWPLPDSCRRVLRVESREFGMREVELRRDQEIVEVRFESPASIDLKLFNHVPRLVDARLRAVRIRTDANGEHVGWRSYAEDSCDEHGRILMTGMQPGRLIIGIQWDARPGESEGEGILLTTSVDAVSGTNHRTIDLPAFHDLTISWNGEAFGSPVDVVMSCSAMSEQSLGFDDIEGTEGLRCDFLPEGTYDVTITGPKAEATKPVDLRDSAEIRFDR